jgi:16S rRNA (guanine527-N7)-methyltransferase
MTYALSASSAVGLGFAFGFLTLFFSVRSVYSVVDFAFGFTDLIPFRTSVVDLAFGFRSRRDGICIVSQPLTLTTQRRLALSLPSMLDAARLADLLQPFLDTTALRPELAELLRTYLELLLRWNARMNLTAIRGPEQIVTRHFGESLFAAAVLRDAKAFASAAGASPTVADLGSGAGFPGIPIKLLVPEIRLTLIESQNKKATFLREVVRTLELKDVEVFLGRAESWNRTANVVTLRAVEKFEKALPAAASLVAESGTLGLLIGTDQVDTTRRALGSSWQVGQPDPIPQSQGRVVLAAKHS